MAYARQSGRHGAISHLRKTSREVELSDEWPATGSSEADLVIERLDLEAVLPQLNAEEREIVVDLALGVGAAETADSLGIKLDALYKRRERIRTRLREFVGRDGGRR